VVVAVVASAACRRSVITANARSAMHATSRGASSTQCHAGCRGPTWPTCSLMRAPG